MEVRGHQRDGFVSKDDLMTRDNYSQDTPASDLYIAGFPCQPFSAAGTSTALSAFNPGRGLLLVLSE